LGGRGGRIAAVAVTLRRGAASAVRARRRVRTPEGRERSGVWAWSRARGRAAGGGRRGSPRNPASAPRRLGGGRPISRCPPSLSSGLRVPSCDRQTDRHTSDASPHVPSREAPVGRGFALGSA
jgi:hypothetical protein